MTDIVAKTGVAFPSASVIRSTTMRDLTGLMAEFWLGVDAASSKKNRVSGAADLTDLAGTLAPVYNSNYATIRSDTSAGASRGLDSALVVPDAVTMVVLQRQASLISGQIAPRIFATDAPGSGSSGIAGNPTAGGKYVFWNGFAGGATDQAELVYGSADSDFHFVAGTGLIGQPGKIYVANGGVITTDVGTRTDPARLATTVKLGGFVNAFNLGQADVAYVAMFNTIKTPSQIADLYADVKAWAASARSLTVS